MNIQEAEEILNATQVHLEMRQADLKKLHTKFYEKEWELKRQIKEYKEAIEHWTNVIEMMRLKASIPVVNY